MPDPAELSILADERILIVECALYEGSSDRVGQTLLLRCRRMQARELNMRLKALRSV